VHTKGHALLSGTLEVSETLPEELRQGLFAQPATYPVIARLSSALPEMGPDMVSTARGFSLKVREVGEAKEGRLREQDFLLVNTPAFFVSDLRRMMPLLRLLPAISERFKVMKRGVSPVLQGVEQLAERLGYKPTGLMAVIGQPPSHPLADTYYSQVPMLYGPYMAKVALVPVSQELWAMEGRRLDLGADEDCLRHAVAAYFSEHGGVWELRVQLCRNLETMPIEDASVVWPETESPYLPVARLTLPSQPAWDANSLAHEHTLAFSPWNCLQAHRPLGSIMRARKEAYRYAAACRQSGDCLSRN
jgi:catalase